MRRWAASAMLCFVMTSAALAGDGLLSFRPAHWVESESPQPTFYISPLDALSFPSPDEGWITGERYVLHVRGDALEVAFVSIAESRTSISFSSPGLGWASGQSAPWPLLRYDGATWRAEHVTGGDWPYWSVNRVMAGPSGRAWAFASFSDRVPADLEVPKSTRTLLHYDGDTWSVRGDLLAAHPTWRLTDACEVPGGQWWFGGVDESAPSGMAALLVRWDGTDLQSMTLSRTDTERSAVQHVRCLPDGTAWAAGVRRAAKGAPRDLLLLRFAAQWQPIAVPAVFPRDPSISAMAPVSADEVWISASCGDLHPECCERFLHYRDGSWDTVNLPLMPGGRCTKVSIADMQFVSRDDGWAVGMDAEPYLGAGRIFHYKNGTWRLRNWNWHFWDAPWFNLFG